jgi:hypothetical protein
LDWEEVDDPTKKGGKKGAKGSRADAKGGVKVGSSKLPRLKANLFLLNMFEESKDESIFQNDVGEESKEQNES